MFANYKKIYAAVIFFFLLLASCSKPKPEPEDYSNCLRCHSGIESISVNHQFDCNACHLRPENRLENPLESHNAIVRNPSDPTQAKLFCGKCHAEEIKTVEMSLHATMAGIINQTRFLWGAQKAASPPIYSANNALKPLPESSSYPDQPQKLVDDFLRKKCLRCHISTAGAKDTGLYRASGCAACHMIYNNDGKYTGKDPCIDKTKPGYPATHTFTIRIPNFQCLHCHNQNHVGADYEGFFEHDYDRFYQSSVNQSSVNQSSVNQSSVIGGSPSDRLYGINHHRLTKDIHAEKGLWCIDCHTKDDIMGNGNIYACQIKVPKQKCTDCHKGFDRTTLSHNYKWHGRVRCSTCHAQWSYQDYGFSVIRQDAGNLGRWRRLTVQGDPYLEKTIERHLKNQEHMLLASKDWLNGKQEPGIWCVGWRFRRWEFMPLGLDHNNKYTILRPLHQYLVSYVDRWENVVLDSIIPQRGDGSGKGWAFMPYVPHTISPVGRKCDACHLNRTAAGLGIFEEITTDTELVIPAPPAIDSMRLLSEKEQKNLMKRPGIYQEGWLLE